MKRVRQHLVREIFAPALRLFRDKLLTDPDVAALRAWAARVDAALAHDEPGAVTSRIDLQRFTATWFEVAGADARRVILYLHGGAFVVETPRLHGAFLTRLARECGAHALMPHYRLAPEHPFPAAPDDALAAYRWLLGRGTDPARIVVAGDSAGGNLALGLLQRLRHEGLPMPACALALSPLTDGTLGGDSLRRNDGLDPMFTRQGLHKLAPLYIPDEQQRAQPLASPLAGDLNGMPPLWLAAGSSELLLDDSVRFAQRCPGAQLQVWHDMPHCFPLFDFLPQAAEARLAMVRFITQSLIATTPAEGESNGTKVQRTDRAGVRLADRSEVARSP